MVNVLLEVKKSHASADFLSVIKLTDLISIEDDYFFEVGKYRLSALIDLKMFDLVPDIISELNSINRHDKWLVLLNFSYFNAINNHDKALKILRKFVDGNIEDIEAVDLLLKQAANLRDFEIINSYYKLRFNHFGLDSTNVDKSTTIVIQSYVKFDTLKDLLDDLLNANLTDNIKLLIIKDFPKNDNSKSKSSKVDDIYYEYYPRLIEKFCDVRFIKNLKNMGTAPTCIKAINLACKDGDASNIIFLEDDCRLSPDFMSWFDFAFDNLLSDDFPFVGGESVLFNDITQSANKNAKNLIKSSSKLLTLEDKYMKIDFVPSTCFAFKTSVWKEYFVYRGMPEGPETLNKYMQSKHRFCLIPIVPRVNDVGMQHEDGYSMLVLNGKVKESKMHYLISSSPVKNFLPFDEEIDDLYNATCLFDVDLIDKYFG
jgi:hypothetical protein